MTLVTQRGDGDCAVAALAMVLSERYDAVYRAASRIHPDAPIKGLYNRELLTLAHGFGLELAPARTYNLDRDDGVLRLYSPQLFHRGHFVAVCDGLVWDPLRAVAPWREYRRRRRATFGTLLRVC